MDYEEFKEMLYKEVCRQAGNEYRVMLQKIAKNNGIERDAVSICKEENTIAPIIYLDTFYEKFCNGKSIAQLSAALLENYQEIDDAVLQMDVGFFADYRKAGRHLYCKLVNIGMNREVLAEIPYRCYLDLAVVYYYMADTMLQGQATILISRKHLELWGIDEEELDRRAWQNTLQDLHPCFQSMQELLREYLEPYEESMQPNPGETDSGEEDAEIKILPMYVLTNQKKMFGAICIRYPELLGKFAEKVGGDYYILPSSVHECILVPADPSMTRDMLREMVTDINHTQVEPQEILADQVYFYSQALGRIIY